uniref:P/Homo B domain-containing protein n=1 Tax=Strongyloides papillosus TaxID=174720 RepID=A0A0N5BKX7_STREA
MHLVYFNANRHLNILLHYIILLILCCKVLEGIQHDSECSGDSNDDACLDPVHTILTLKKRDDSLAESIAASHGMYIKGRPFLESSYFLVHRDMNHYRKKRSVIHESINKHPDVVSITSDHARKRVKRGYLYEKNLKPFEGPEYNKNFNIRKRRDNNLPIPALPFKDPLYKDQWYLIGKAIGGYDMNVREAWLMGYAGRNVSISILDDGIQLDHPDLAKNYDPLASTDINGGDDDPTPQNNGDNKHGTRCAGEVSAIAGNNQCGVGVAFKSKIGGVRMLDGPVSDSVEAASLSLNQDHIDIYSASWGPEDDGKTFDGPGPKARQAFYRGIKKGRNGKGNIFVWASGNGGSKQDSCSADGYTTSIYTLSISSATYHNSRPWYLEECPSTIATTYSSASINQPAIVTVDVPSGCTKSHTGTSASAPIAAGIIALALEANPSLTWRDMQHIVLRTANPTPLLNNPGWSINGVGRRISNQFGYGLMDAGALVKLAKVWRNVPEQHLCTYKYEMAEPSPRPVSGRFQMNFTLDVSGCADGRPVLYLEHVQVISTIRYSKRGDLKLTLFSPKGTRSVILPIRPQDYNSDGIHKWPFLSVQMWGEDPRGIWTLMIESFTNDRTIGGTIHDWDLLLYGTEEPAQPTDPKYPPPVPSSQKASAKKGFFESASETLQKQDKESSNLTSINNNKVEHILSFGDITSVGNCHEQCLGGCSESKSAVSCFACKSFTQSLRNKYGFKCVDKCDEGYYIDGDKCKQCGIHCRSCSKAEICETCHGAQLLIDVDHWGHFDHGQCVDNCPEGLYADYDTNSYQARCVLKKNPCSDGYYMPFTGKGCSVCDEACRKCHGAGLQMCDECAEGYGNRTMGYCRKCCVENEDPRVTSCEDCASYVSLTEAPKEQPFTWSFFLKVFFFAITITGGIILFIFKKTGSELSDSFRNRSSNYTQLPIMSSSKLLISEEDSESEEDSDATLRV